MGNKLTLTDVVFTDSSLPVLYDDPLISNGTLVLVDFGHSKGKLTSVPPNGALLPNIAESVSATLVGSSAVSPNVVRAYTEGAMLPEITAKGGLQVIKSKINDLNNSRFTVRIPTAVKDYLLLHKDNSYYFSVWQRITRTFDDASVPLMALAEAAYSNIFLLNLGANGNLLGVNTNVIGASSSLNPTTAVGVAKQQLAVSKATGALGNMAYTDLFIFGGCPSAGVMNAALHKGGSQILYRVYLEDLTVSGRTYAAVKAQDDALFQAAFGAGGKFADDIFTDPSTLP